MKRIKFYFKLIRLKQWVKNVFIFAPIVFSQNLFIIDDLKRIIITFFGFSLIASSSYVLNDIFDREKDKLHPEKRKRPIASGKVNIFDALILFTFLLILGSALLLFLNLKVFLVGISYFVMIFFYSIYLKKIVIIDIMIIAIGFDLRALAGAVSINVVLSPWLIIDLFLLAIFLAATKRRQELVKLKESGTHKEVLNFYSLPMIDQIVPILTSTTLISYIIYTLSNKVKESFNTQYFFLTVPFVIYGIFRYLYLIYKKDTYGDPTTLVLKDIPLIIDILLWSISVVLIIFL